MKFPVYLHRTESGSYSGFIPDIPGCFFAGDTIDEALTDAVGAVDLHLEVLTERSGTLPVANDIGAHLDHEDCQGGVWAIIDVDLNKHDGKAIKLNMTLPQNLLARIDQFVGDHPEYRSRSGFFAEIARKEIQRA